MVSGAGHGTVPRLSLQGAHLSGQCDMARCGDLPQSAPGAGVKALLLCCVPVSVTPTPRPLKADASIRSETVVIPGEASGAVAGIVVLKHLIFQTEDCKL